MMFKLIIFFKSCYIALWISVLTKSKRNSVVIFCLINVDKIVTASGILCTSLRYVVSPRVLGITTDLNTTVIFKGSSLCLKIVKFQPEITINDFKKCQAFFRFRKVKFNCPFQVRSIGSNHHRFQLYKK